MDPAAEFTFTLWQLAFSAVGLVVAIIGLGFAAARVWAAVHPIMENRRSRRLLEEKFSRGPFDEATIEQATRYYIRPKCMNVDPGQERELRHALVATKEDLFEKVDHFLDQDTGERHLLVLADSGMGKTSFVLNYYAYNRRRSERKRHRLALVPLGIPNADEMIAEIPDQQETAIFLDAFDEDVKAIEDHHTRIRSLMEACRGFKRVVVTCRTQFFPSDEEIPVETGVARIGPRRAGDSGILEFWKLYLAPFDDEDVRTYLKKRFPVWQWTQRQEATQLALKIPLLSARPMLLAHIPDVVATWEGIWYACELYEVMIQAWIERESGWVNKAALREFSERLAVDMYVKREARGMERIPRDELPALADAWGIQLKEWQIRGRSLLNRDAEGNYKFAHRSIMEYLFVVRLVNGDTTCYDVTLTDQEKLFLFEILTLGNLKELNILPGAALYVPGQVLTLQFGARRVGEEAMGDFRPEVYPTVGDLVVDLAIRVNRHPVVYSSLPREVVGWLEASLGEARKQIAHSVQTECDIATLNGIATEANFAATQGSKLRWNLLWLPVPSNLHSLLEYCRRNGFSVWNSLRYVNSRWDSLWLEPVSFESDEFLLKFKSGQPMDSSSVS